MKNEVAYGYEVCLTAHRERNRALRFIAAKPPLHIGEANASFFIF